MENKMENKTGKEIEVIAKIKDLATIDTNITKIKEMTIADLEKWQNVVFSKDDVDIAKKEKALARKKKEAIATARKKITAEFNAPLEFFLNEAKEAERICEQVYTIINEQAVKFDNEELEKKVAGIEKFFDECEKPDFVKLKDLGVNITRSASDKVLKDEITKKIGDIKADVAVIETLPNSSDVMAEYLISRNLGSSIQTVADREERKKQLELQKAEAEKIAQKEQVPTVPIVPVAEPVVEPVVKMAKVVLTMPAERVAKFLAFIGKYGDFAPVVEELN